MGGIRGQMKIGAPLVQKTGLCVQAYDINAPLCEIPRATKYQQI